MKSFFILTTAKRDLGGGCGCANKIKLELQVNDRSLDFLGQMGFKTADDIQGFCSLCGKPYRFRRLTISAVEDLRTT